MTDEPCPICSRNLEREPISVTDILGAKYYQCSQCGNFIFDFRTSMVQGFDDSRQLISAWIRRQNKLGNTYPIVAKGDTTGIWFQNLQRIDFPQTVNEKLNELLKSYMRIAKDDYLMIIKSSQHHTLISDIAAKDYTEIKGLNKLLIELGYLSAQRDPPYEHVTITAKGWLRIDELSKAISTSHSAFIAMWFDPQTNDCREAIKEAVTACGYNPVIVDETEFNDFIMDEVITLIRQARFLIADLTCLPEIDNQSNSHVIQGVRGGVYWEAGMAYGLEKTVIQTCRDDDCSKRRIHFDLNQYQTIYWKQEELATGIRPLSGHIADPTFAERLAQRILATVGKGNYIAPE